MYSAFTKKYSVFFLFFIIYVAASLFVSCISGNDGYHIGVAQCSEDDWRVKMNEEIRREAMFHDVSVEIRSAEDDNARQTEDIDYFIGRGVDLLIVTPNEAEVITPAIERAFDAGIPVVLVDRKSSSEKYTAFVGGDNLAIGADAGMYVAEQLAGRGAVLEIKGLKGSTPAIERHEGFSAVMETFPGIEVTTVETDWTSEMSYRLMDSLLRAGFRADFVFAHNDRMAIGAFNALEDFDAESAIDMRFVGIDALPGKGNGVDHVLDGDLAATFIYPTGGEKVMQTAMAILEGRPFERTVILSSAMVDRTNARVVMLQSEQIGERDRQLRMLNDKIDDYWKKYSGQTILMYSFLVIIILFAALLAVIVKAYWRDHRMNEELSRQKTQLEAQRDQLEEQRDKMVALTKQLEEATQAKLVFFTNVSHDFRTPLTLIADPVDQMIENGGLDEKQASLMHLVKKNVKILLRLVNQILDFRTYENGKMGLTLSNADFRNCIEEWSGSFRALAARKHIHFSVELQKEGDFNVDFDIEKMERVYFNLLSNAFKFTPENGSISVSLVLSEGDAGETVRLSVTDDGQGISSAHIEHIFDRFYKIDVTHSGSGIGLALTKAFMELHGGSISVESEVGKGSTFRVEFPVRRNLAPASGESLSPAIGEQSVVDELSDMDSDSIVTEGSRRVLVIDDNRDVRDYIKSILKDDYTVIEACDGQDGIRKAMKYVPDAIICDVMMPVMDGFECCRRLKGELQTSHIPVMMLTACTMDEQRVSGYEQGADSYISKPFSSRLLQVRLKNLIDNHDRLRQFFGDMTTVSKESVSDMDKDFAMKFKALIEENLSDSGLSVELLGEKMGLGRVQLYRKVKALTNYSPVELLRIARLKRAASLLASSDKTVAEIAYEVGFTSPSYFAKCYKEYFHESPTDLLKRK